jgi:hypothetical protein
MMNKKAQLTIFIVFIVTAIVIIVIAAVLAPLGVLLNTKFYAEAEKMYDKALEDHVSEIQNTTIKNQITATLNSGLAAQTNNIEVNNALFQYSWVFMVLITGLVLFLVTRRLVEFQGGGFI